MGYRYITLVVQTDGTLATTYALSTLKAARNTMKNDVRDEDVTRAAVLDTVLGEIVEQIGKQK